MNSPPRRSTDDFPSESVGSAEKGEPERSRSFDPTAKMDHPRLALEASAGTGKTHALSTIAARAIAEDALPLRELLVVTFTRAAAAELRDRLRSRLGEFAVALEADEDPDDALLVSLRATDRELRAQRVRAGIADFDAATITTIHGFAQQVIGTLGSTAGSDPDAVLVEDTRELVTQAATDVLTAEVLTNTDHAFDLIDLEVLTRGSLLRINNPASRTEPSIDQLSLAPVGQRSAQQHTDATAARLVELVDQVVDRVERHRRRVGTLSFDGLLVSLRRILADRLNGTAARKVLQARYSLALIDEFQDTDPVQWEVFDSLFGAAPTDPAGAAPTDPAGAGPGSASVHAHPDRQRSMVMVGDPKQAIYAFRGANVHTYLQAVREPGTELRNLMTNWRSDPDLIEATAVLLRGTTFGSEEIGFHDVRSAAANEGRRMTHVEGAPLPAVSLRLTIGDAVERYKRSEQITKVGSAVSATFADLARHIRDLLETALIPDTAIELDDGLPPPQRRLRPDDVAVLISKNVFGPQVREALGALGIPAVISRGDSVLNSEAATHWHRLLAALAQPSNPRRVRAACTTWFVGADAPGIAAIADEDLIAHQERLSAWGSVLSRDGVAAMVGRIFADTSVAERVLRLPQGERHMTDLDHLAELLCGAVSSNTGPAGLLEAFEDLGIRSDDGDPDTDMAARRVESEAAAVQIMTTFVAKGLEFPVVCCPTLWDSAGTTTETDFIWWDEAEGSRVVDLAPKLNWASKDDHDERKALAEAELAGTNLRLLYVALTRARHHSAIWWSPTQAAWKTGLAKVLFARDESGAIDADAFTAPQVEALDIGTSRERLEAIASATGGTIDVVEVGASEQAADKRPWLRDDTGDQPDLETSELDRRLDRTHRRWSFTAIAARRDQSRNRGFDDEGDSVGDGLSEDEGDETDPDVADTPVPHGETSADPATRTRGDHTGTAGDDLPLGSIAGGTTFGTLVHEVLERVDFTSPALADDLSELIAQRLRFNPWPLDRSQLTDGLVAVIDTPLGALFGDRALRSLAPADRLDELDFDLLVGHNDPTGVDLGHTPGARDPDAGHAAAQRAGSVTDRSIGALVAEHLDEHDPYRRWAAQLADGAAHSRLAGHLTGSIDLVARVGGGTEPDRFVVVDYKTNRLTPDSGEPTPELFEPDRLPEHMAHSDYPLQALLYSVALHRYLRWRIRDYDPEVHLGGIAYMFVRGMAGPDTPTHDGVPNGLAVWRPPCALIEDLSAHLAGAKSIGPRP
ncbi:MAG: UvrD-helicase domain-containing protein [Microthrixaceae bacterium]